MSSNVRTDSSATIEYRWARCTSPILYVIFAVGCSISSRSNFSSLRISETASSAHHPALASRRICVWADSPVWLAAVLHPALPDRVPFTSDVWIGAGPVRISLPSLLGYQCSMYKKLSWALAQEVVEFVERHSLLPANPVVEGDVHRSDCRRRCSRSDPTLNLINRISEMVRCAAR